MSNHTEAIVQPGANAAYEGGGYRSTAYKRWQEAEGVAVVGGFHIPDLSTVPVTYWKRMGALAAFLDLEGTEEWNGAYICEVPPGESTLRQCHLFEVLIYVLRGNGITSVRNADEHADRTFEWGPGSVFALPPNVRYRHFNTSGSASARFLAVTSAPLVMNLFHNDEFVFDNDFVFRDRYKGDLSWVENDRAAGGVGTLTEAPNGTVVLADWGLSRISASGAITSFVSTSALGAALGLRDGSRPYTFIAGDRGGVAVAANGDIYVDTPGQNGFPTLPSILEVSSAGQVRVIWKS